MSPGIRAATAWFPVAGGFALLGLRVLAPDVRPIAVYRRLGTLPGPTRSFAIGPVTLVGAAMPWPDPTAFAALV